MAVMESPANPMIRPFRPRRELPPARPVLGNDGAAQEVPPQEPGSEMTSQVLPSWQPEEVMSVTEHHLAAVADQKRWDAVLERDPRQDGKFVYAVTSTQIYCRPSCPSRRPAPHRVRFFLTPDQAEDAGYRACRRCEPRNSERTSDRRIQLAREYLDKYWDRTVTLDELSRVVQMSPFHLQRTFKRVLGLTPKSYTSARRLERMKSRLKQGDTVSRATYEA